MNSSIQPLSRLLLPVDTDEAYRRAIPLAGLIARTMAISAEHVDLLHVVAGSFLSEHMNKLDIAGGEVPTPEDMRLLRKNHLDGQVTPLLLTARGLLHQQTGTDGAAGLLVIDGDPVKKISQVCREGAYSTLVMSRKNEISARLTGSVVAGVLHRHVDATVYLVGDDLLAAGISPFARCLIGIDGSPASSRAVLEASLLLSRARHEVERIYLVHVLDQSCYYDEDGQTCLQASESGQQSLEQAVNMMIGAQIDPARITTVIHFGRPGTVLADEAASCDATMVFIGMRDRSRMAQVFLGSVCTDMIQNCRERTIVLAC